MVKGVVVVVVALVVVEVGGGGGGGGGEVEGRVGGGELQVILLLRVRSAHLLGLPFGHAWTQSTTLRHANIHSGHRLYVGLIDNLTIFTFLIIFFPHICVSRSQQQQQQ